VVIAPSTRRLTGGLFEYADLGAVKLKGLGAPVMASRVVRESAAESRFEALHGRDLTPLVGRDEDRAGIIRHVCDLAHITRQSSTRTFPSSERRTTEGRQDTDEIRRVRVRAVNSLAQVSVTGRRISQADMLNADEPRCP
jgi:hypothetical protein